MTGAFTLHPRIRSEKGVREEEIDLGSCLDSLHTIKKRAIGSYRLL